MNFIGGVFAFVLGMLVMFVIIAYSDKLFFGVLHLKITNGHKSDYLKEEKKIKKFKTKLQEELK